MADNLPDVYIRFMEGKTPVIDGDSLDNEYNGEDGWLAIGGFNFGFGWGGSSDSASRLALPAGTDPALARTLMERDRALQRTQQGQPAASPAGAGGGANTANQEGSLKPSDFKFSRAPSAASKLLVQTCREVKLIPQAELVVCRSAGDEYTVKGSGGVRLVKIPFLRLTFERLYLTGCELSVSSSPIPEESIEFVFEKVQMETVWTDNATGKRVSGGVNRVEYDFSKTDASRGIVTRSD